MERKKNNAIGKATKSAKKYCLKIFDFHNVAKSYIVVLK
jgi:hypothetical protein